MRILIIGIFLVSVGLINILFTKRLIRFNFFLSNLIYIKPLKFLDEEKNKRILNKVEKDQEITLNSPSQINFSRICGFLIVIAGIYFILSYLNII